MAHHIGHTTQKAMVSHHTLMCLHVASYGEAFLIPDCACTKSCLHLVPNRLTSRPQSHYTVALQCWTVQMPIAQLSMQAHSLEELVLCRTHRRKRNVILFFLEGAVQWVNLVFYLAPNVHLFYSPCQLFAPFTLWAGFVRWTCWNTVGNSSANFM